MISLLKWLSGFLRLENIKALLGSLKRRFFGWDYLEMRVDLHKTVSREPELIGDIRISGYSKDLEKECIDLLNSVTSLGLWNDSNFPKLLDSVENPENDIFILFEKDFPVGFTAVHKKNQQDNSVEIGYVAVRPKSRGKQYGFILLSYIISKLKNKNLDYVYLRSDSFRVNAIKTYLKCGFIPYSKNKNQEKRWKHVLDKIKIC